VILGDAWGALGGIASVIAACAALVTIFYARATVIQARSGQRDAKIAHSEELLEQRALIEQAQAAHHEEMVERARALSAEIKLHRIVQLERVVETLVELIRVARDEEIHPPPGIEGVVLPAGMTLIPTVLARLRTNIVLLERLGPGEKLLIAGQLAMQGSTLSPPKIVSTSLAALNEIESLARNDDDLRLDS
jgi:hypothetical protein